MPKKPRKARGKRLAIAAAVLAAAVRAAAAAVIQLTSHTAVLAQALAASQIARETSG